MLHANNAAASHNDPTNSNVREWRVYDSTSETIIVFCIKKQIHMSVDKTGFEMQTVAEILGWNVIWWPR